MSTFCKLLSDRGRVNFWKLCNKYGIVPQEEKQRAIHVEARVEDLEEIRDMMEEPPNYTISKEGRE